MGITRHHGGDRLPPESNLKTLIATNSANKNIVLKTPTMRGSNLSDKVPLSSYLSSLDTIKNINMVLPVPEVVSTSTADVGKIILRLNTDKALFVPDVFNIEYAIETQTNEPMVTGILPPNKLEAYLDYNSTGTHYVFFRLRYKDIVGGWSNQVVVNVTTIKPNDVNSVRLYQVPDNTSVTPHIQLRLPINVSGFITTVLISDADDVVIWESQVLNNNQHSVFVPYGVLDHGRQYKIWYRTDSTTNGIIYGSYSYTEFRTRKDNTIITVGGVYQGIGEIASLVYLGNNRVFIAARPKTIVPDSGVYENWYIGYIESNGCLVKDIRYTASVSFRKNDSEYVASTMRTATGAVYIFTLPHRYLYRVDNNGICTLVNLQTLPVTTSAQVLPMTDSSVLLVLEDVTNTNNKREKWYKWSEGVVQWELYNDIPLEYTGAKYFIDSEGYLYRIGGSKVSDQSSSRLVSVSNITSKTYSEPSYNLPMLPRFVSGDISNDGRIILAEYYKREFKGEADEWVMYVTSYHFKTRTMHRVATMGVYPPTEVNPNVLCVTDDNKAVVVVNTATTESSVPLLSTTVMDI